MKKLTLYFILSLMFFTSCDNHKERTVCSKITAMTKLTYIHTNDRCRMSVYDTNKIPVTEEFTYESAKEYKVGDTICLVIYENKTK